MGQSQDPSQPNKKLNQYNSYLKYSSLAIQLFVVIGLFGWLGYRGRVFMDVEVEHIYLVDMRYNAVDINKVAVKKMSSRGFTCTVADADVKM